MNGARITTLALLNHAGQQFDPTAQAVAGRPILLLFRRSVPDTGDLAQFDALRGEAADVATAAILVVSGREPVPLDDAILWDADGGVAEGFGVEAGGFIILDPGGRLAGVVPLDSPVQAIERCRELYADQSIRMTEQQAPVLLVPHVFEPSLCERLIGYWDSKEKSDDRVANPEHGHLHKSSTVKKRADVIIADPDIFETVKVRLAASVVPEMALAFQTEIKGFEALRVGCYEGSAHGHFARHRDNTTPYTTHRQFALSLNLNDGYEGGQVAFPEFGRGLYRPPAGGAVVFSCSLLHEALPVTAGRRFAMFTFLFDAAGAAREREIRQKLMAAGEMGVKADR